MRRELINPLLWPVSAVEYRVAGGAQNVAHEME